MEFKCGLKMILWDKRIYQKVFAERIEVSPSALSQVIRSKTVPSFETTYKICTELDMRIEEIWMKKERA